MKGREQGCCKGLAFDTDEAMSASSKMAQDADEAMSESSWAALAKGKERDWWSIDVEGDMDKLEVAGPWSGTEGGSVDPKWKIGNEEKEKPKEVEMEMNDDVLQEESIDIQSPKRRVEIRRDARLRAGDSGNQPGRSRGNGLRAIRPW